MAAGAGAMTGAAFGFGAALGLTGFGGTDFGGAGLDAADLGAVGFGAPGFFFAVRLAGPVCFGLEAGFLAFAFADSLADLFRLLFAVFFVAGFFAAFFVFFVFPAAFLAASFLTRFVDAAAFTAPFFAFFFFGDFLLVATTDSFVARKQIIEIVGARSAYRVASASSENTEKTSGFRSRL